jgi:hypothetical protein
MAFMADGDLHLHAGAALERGAALGERVRRTSTVRASTAATGPSLPGGAADQPADLAQLRGIAARSPGR